MTILRIGRRMLPILLLTLAACAPGVPTQLPALAKASCPPIRIGAVIADSDTQGGNEQRQGYELALAEINKEGGVQTCPVELVFPPDGETLNPDSAQIAMLELVDKNVAAIVGATSPNATKRAAALANYFKIPFMIAGDAGDDVILTGTQWLFRIPPKNKAYASSAFDMVKNVTSGQANVSILFEQTEYGESAAVAAGSAVLNHGLHLASYQRYDPVQVDYAALFSNLQNAATDVVYVISTNPAQAGEMVQALRKPQSVAKDFSLASLGLTMVIGNGSGFTSSAFLYDSAGKLSPDLENLIITVPWQADLPWKANENFSANLKAYQMSSKLAAVQPVSRVVEAYTALRVLVKAMNELPASTPDWAAKLATQDGMSAYRDSLAKTLRAPQGGSWETPMGQISFDAEGQNSIQETPLVQVIDGALTTVYPDKYKQHDLVYTQGW